MGRAAAEPAFVERVIGTLTCLLGLALSLPVGAQNQPAGTLPLRGSLRGRTALSWNYNRQNLQKIFPTLESGLFSLQETRLDWLGMADEGYRFTYDGWLAYRGALSAFTDARPQLTALPGFEWLGSGQQARNLTIYGSDHCCPGWSRRPQWATFRVGRMLADMAADEPDLRFPKQNWLLPDVQVTKADQLYDLALATDLFAVGTYNGPGPMDQSNLKGLEKPYFMGTEPQSTDPYQNVSAPGLLYPPIESIWGPPSSDLSASLDLYRGHQLGQELLNPTGLLRMNAVAEQVPNGASALLIQLLEQLRRGEPRATRGYLERLPLPPGWRLGKLPEATRDNPQYSQAYGEYYALLGRGLSLFQNYGAGTSLAKESLETARWTWYQGTPDQHILDLNPASIRTWDQMVDWLERYDPQQPIVAMLSTPTAGGTQGWLQDLDPRKLQNRPKARERFALVEMVWNLQTAADFPGQAVPGQGPYPTGQPPGGSGPYPGGSPLAAPTATSSSSVNGTLPYYNVGLRNGWRLAPATGVDNQGRLDAHGSRPVPGVRSTFTGLYPGSDQTIVNGGRVNLGTGADRIREFLLGLHTRRTFVSENPYVDALLYAREVGTGRTVAMGGQLFQSSSASPTTFEFTLRLDVPVRNQTTQNRRIKVEDIRVVQVVERERDFGAPNQRLSIVNATRNASATQIGPEQLSMLVTDEVPVFKYYSSGAVAQPGTSAGIGTILANYGLTGPQANPAEPDTYPLPVTLTWRATVRPHQPGGILGYYVKAELPVMGNLTAGSLVTAPLWTVGDWSRFKSVDEDV